MGTLQRRLNRCFINSGIAALASTSILSRLVYRISPIPTAPGKLFKVPDHNNGRSEPRPRCMFSRQERFIENRAAQQYRR